MDRTANGHGPSRYEILDRTVHRIAQIRAAITRHNNLDRGGELLAIDDARAHLLFHLLDGLMAHLECPNDNWGPLPDASVPVRYYWDGLGHKTLSVEFWIQVGNRKIESSIGISPEPTGDMRGVVLGTQALCQVRPSAPESFLDFYQRATGALRDAALLALKG